MIEDVSPSASISAMPIFWLQKKVNRVSTTVYELWANIKHNHVNQVLNYPFQPPLPVPLSSLEFDNRSGAAMCEDANEIPCCWCLVKKGDNWCSILQYPIISHLSWSLSAYLSSTRSIEWHWNFNKFFKILPIQFIFNFLSSNFIKHVVSILEQLKYAHRMELKAATVL